ncbi:hypothetical protein BCR35DRAFT_211547 [Leucosporidium creatinivorum]|uniref:Uncharacterized protein n=1 Tax=Leucosporidium creatinivorum TaxID=106004 RepID=A0A1Y2DCV8_9BASI|nr:hypothetical protein BCR35DRAFT_211547 [Leucosporidium creatinivorum]
MTTSLSTADFFNKLCPTVFGKSVRAEAVLPPKGGQASFVVTGIERRKRSKDKIGDDETAAVDLVRWFCTNMELDPSNRLLLEEPWDAYCSWHPSPPSLPRRAIEPTKFAGYLSAIRPEIPEVVKLLGGMMTLYGVKLRNEWDPVDLTRAIGRDVGAMRRVKSEAVLPFSTEVKLSPASAGTALWKVGDPKKVGDLRRKSEGEVESAESPDTKKRRKDSGFHEKAVEGELSFACSPSCSC